MGKHLRRPRYDNYFGDIGVLAQLLGGVMRCWPILETGGGGALLAVALSLALAPAAAAYPPDADSHGFVGYPGGRCAGVDNALAIGRTAQSLAVICQDSTGAMYYMGFGLENGLPVRVNGVMRYFSAGYTVNNLDAQYTVTPDLFEVDGAHSVLSREQWFEYWPSY